MDPEPNSVCAHGTEQASSHASEAKYRQLTTGSQGDNSGVGGHRLSLGADHIPRTPLPKRTRLFVNLCSACLFVVGTSLALSGAMVTGLYAKYTDRHCPAIWWTGFAPVSLSVFGFYTAAKRSRRYLFKWGVALILCCVTQTAVMGVVGNFTMALYDAWPLIDSYGGQPLCKIMVGWCYCQDYFHGVYSSRLMSGVQYIEESTRWKDTGFRHCAEVRRVSHQYFTAIGSHAAFVAISLCACALSLVGSVCAPHTTAAFSRLDDSFELEKDAAHTSDLSQDNEMTEMQPVSLVIDANGSASGVINETNASDNATVMSANVSQNKQTVTG